MIKEMGQGPIVERRARGHFYHLGYNNLEKGEVGWKINNSEVYSSEV
jgi:hypothetical protein